MKNLRIQRLEIENFLRVKSITITPDKNVIRLKGRNMQGKTSVLRAIQAALGGKKMIPKRAVRDGEEEGSVRIDLGEYLVECVFKPEGRVDLTLRTADGAAVRSPATTLAGFIGEISFDALAFMRLDPKAQVELLRKLVGVDFTALDGERAALYMQRTDVGRDRDKAIAQGAGAPVQVWAEVSLADLTAQLQAVSDAEGEVSSALRWVTTEESRLANCRTEVERLRKALGVAQQLVEAAASKVDAARVAAQKGHAHLATMGDGAAIREKLRTAEADNARARDWNAKRARKLEGDALHKQYDAITKQIDGLDAKKREMAAAAKLPVEGLDFTGAEVTFGGRPLSQASDREQVLISAGIGHALSPKLAALLIREGAFLDEDGWKALSVWADERDVQVWIEDVGTDGEGILIEDGMVMEGDPLWDPAVARSINGANPQKPKLSQWAEEAETARLRVHHGEMDGPLPSEVNEAEAMLLGDDEEIEE